jgi:hypothetical protein
VQGGDFTSEFKTPFGVANTTGIRDNASVLNLNPFPPDFCFSYSYTPAVTVRNLGYNDLTSLTFGIKGSQKTYPDAHGKAVFLPAGERSFHCLPLLLTVPMKLRYQSGK